jgi:hypothetical protein
MANGGKDVRLGDDKRPVSIIPNNEDFLYNIQNGEILVDEFGNPLLTQIDQFFTADATAERSTSVTLPSTTFDTFERKLHLDIGIHTATYNVDYDIRISSPTVLPQTGSAVGFGTTVGTSTGGFVDVGNGVSNAHFQQFHFLDVKSRTDQGGTKNKLYFSDTSNVNSTLVEVDDKIEGHGIADGTRVSKVFGSRLILSNAVDSSVLSGITTLTVDITRSVVRAMRSDNVLKVEEAFKETSEVSSSLLGIPRAETQLSLFSNVSSYGLNNDEFEYFTFNGGISFGTWDSRSNKTYGNRYNANRREEVQESAIRLDSFAVPYAFPFGPKFEQVGFYNEVFYIKYKNFLKMGNQLYTYYTSGLGSGQGYPTDWPDKFLNPTNANVNDDNVNYVAGITTSFAAIDTWTDTWRFIDEGTGLIDPITNESVTFATVAALNLDGGVGGDFNSTNTRPGYNSNNKKYSFLQSRRVFRYQPGRISGFTFGLRASTETKGGAELEWGIKNPTDQYVFRMDSGFLSIIRRSTIPLPGSALERSGLTTLDQTFEGTGDPFDDREFWTINVPRDNFNGDALDGNGPSGYLIKPENVTMYKIEFGWYGAIGCRFYAYIPAGPGEARWVVMHTFVIENSIGQPCLQDSYFRMVYQLDVTSNRVLREPVFLYKYGASYYIDGGDEGTSQIYSASSKVKTINTIENRSLIGIQPKNFLQNSLGDEIKNKKMVIPTTMNITSDALAQVEVVKCRACPGFGHVYTPGISAGVSGRTLNVKLASSNMFEAVGSFFQKSDLGAKVIAPGFWDAYIAEVSGPDQTGDDKDFVFATIKGYKNSAYPTLLDQEYDLDVRDAVSGITTTILAGDSVATYGYPIRLSNQNAHYFASDFKFTGNKIEIQYLNPGTGDSYGHFADFAIGITDYEPIISLGNLTGFNKPGVGTTDIIKTNVLPMEAPYIEHTHQRMNLNEDGIVFGETWSSLQPPRRGAIDFRIPSPSGDVSGLCSKATVEVLDVVELTGFNQVSNASDTNIPGTTGTFLVRQGALPADVNFDGGQVKLSSEVNPSAAKYVGVSSSYTIPVDGVPTEFGYIEIDQSVTNTLTDFAIDIRPVKISATGNPDRIQLFRFNPFPLYFFAKLGDNATIHNISIKETSGEFQRTISPRLYKLGSNTNIILTNTDNFATPPTNFEEVTRLSSAEIDKQNEQKLRPTTKLDTIYVGEDQTLEVNMSKIFGQDRNVITPDNQNIEATFLVAKKLDSSGGNTIEATLNYKEQ